MLGYIEISEMGLLAESDMLSEKKAELERSNQELQNFAYVASHDLQEPLRKIRAFGDHLKSKYTEVLDETGQDYLSRMCDAAERLQTLIGDILAFSRVTSKAKPFTKVNLSRTVEAVVSDFEFRIAEENVRIDIGELPTVDADDSQIRQVFQNLISNALKFRRPDGEAIVKVYSDISDNGENRIMVEDNGIGFDEKYLDRIFMIFQRLHGRDKYKGTGIGLAITRKIIERHHGSLTAKSVPGEGSTFIITLPATHIKEESQELKADKQLISSM
jgi:light-regulated signal transduction histidine kinase (bacteriophytochrome)